MLVSAGQLIASRRSCDSRPTEASSAVPSSFLQWAMASVASWLRPGRQRGSGVLASCSSVNDNRLQRAARSAGGPSVPPSCSLHRLVSLDSDACRQGYGWEDGHGAAACEHIKVIRQDAILNRFVMV